MLSEDAKGIKFVGRRHEQITCSNQHQWFRLESMEPREDFSKRPPEMSDTQPFTARKGRSPRFRNRFGLRNIKMIGEAASAEEAAATFHIFGRAEEADLGLVTSRGFRHPLGVLEPVPCG